MFQPPQKALWHPSVFLFLQSDTVVVRDPAGILTAYACQANVFKACMRIHLHVDPQHDASRGLRLKEHVKSRLGLIFEYFRLFKHHCRFRIHRPRSLRMPNDAFLHLFRHQPLKLPTRMRQKQRQHHGTRKYQLRKPVTLLADLLFGERFLTSMIPFLLLTYSKLSFSNPLIFCPEARQAETPRAQQAL